MPASGKDAYTTLRGRLIVTNGYCEGGCAERAEQTQQMARPEPAVRAEPAPRPPAAAGVAPLRVVR
ncbi:hypothetical protein ACTMTI_47505 [Nonomuraea sp. H19]|uniref:hypothetical protein n=1 Tax=Nonomuraea sp. H19 TaxID=3452206 RepID=UPI003F8AFFCF